MHRWSGEAVVDGLGLGLGLELGLGLGLEVDVGLGLGDGVVDLVEVELGLGLRLAVDAVLGEGLGLSVALLTAVSWATHGLVAADEGAGLAAPISKAPTRPAGTTRIPEIMPNAWLAGRRLLTDTPSPPWSSRPGRVRCHDGPVNARKHSPLPSFDTWARYQRAGMP